jgi:hypothetical protein
MKRGQRRIGVQGETNHNQGTAEEEDDGAQSKEQNTRTANFGSSGNPMRQPSVSMPTESADSKNYLYGKSVGRQTRKETSLRALDGGRETNGTGCSRAGNQLELIGVGPEKELEGGVDVGLHGDNRDLGAGGMGRNMEAHDSTSMDIAMIGVENHGTGIDATGVSMAKQNLKSWKRMARKNMQGRADMWTKRKEKRGRNNSMGFEKDEGERRMGRD